jgi:multidrug efflux pump subunit AcrA (membrane-fusion protein)
MPEIKHEGKGAGRLAFLPGLAVAVVLGLFIYSGIHGRVEAEFNLQQATDQAAIEDVNVVCPNAAAPIDEVVLPGATQPFVNSPIYARTNGYLVKWYYDIGAKVKQGDLLATIDTPELDKQLEQVRADLETARSNLALSKTTAERWQQLVKTRSVSQQSTDQAMDNFSATEASVDSYAANVRRLEDLVSFEKVYRYRLANRRRRQFAEQGTVSTCADQHSSRLCRHPGSLFSRCAPGRCGDSHAG